MPSNDRRVHDRRFDDPRVTALVAQVDILATAQTELAKQLAFNTEITAKVVQNTADIIEVWNSMKGGMHVLGWLGAIAKWLTIIAACITAVVAAFYAATHFGPKQ